MLGQMGGFGQQQGSMGGNLSQGPDMSMVSQILAQMRGQQRPQGGTDLMSMLPMLYSMLQGGGGGGQITPQATMMGQRGLGMANQSPLSLLNPQY